MSYVLSSALENVLVNRCMSRNFVNSSFVNFLLISFRVMSVSLHTTVVPLWPYHVVSVSRVFFPTLVCQYLLILTDVLSGNEASFLSGRNSLCTERDWRTVLYTSRLSFFLQIVLVPSTKSIIEILIVGASLSVRSLYFCDVNPPN